MSANEAVEKVFKLQEDFENARKEAIALLLKQRDDIAAQLTSLGYSESSRKANAFQRRRADPQKQCPVCGEKGHDARRHKGEKRQH